MTFSNLVLHSFPEKSETVTPAEAAPAPAASDLPAPPAESSQNTEGNWEHCYQVWFINRKEEQEQGILRISEVETVAESRPLMMNDRQ